jgi:hypothetical protein
MSVPRLLARWSAQYRRIQLIHRLYELRMEITRETIRLWLACRELQTLQARREGRVA